MNLTDSFFFYRYCNNINNKICDQGCAVCTELTGVGAVVFGPVQTSILAHLEIEALSAEQPGHYALQLWFCTDTDKDRGRRTTENIWRMLHISP